MSPRPRTGCTARRGRVARSRSSHCSEPPGTARWRARSARWRGPRRPSRMSIARSAGRGSGRSAGTSAYDVDFVGTECRLNINAKITRDAGVTEAQETSVKDVTRAEFLPYLGQQVPAHQSGAGHRRLHAARDRHVRHQRGARRDRPASGDGPRQSPQLVRGLQRHRPRARARSTSSACSTSTSTPTSLNRATATSPGVFRDHSIMGNYYDEGRARRGGEAAPRPADRRAHLDRDRTHLQLTASMV